MYSYMKMEKQDILKKKEKEDMLTPFQEWRKGG
jgi:hypothetical protein